MFGRIGQGFGRLGGSRHMSSEVKKVTLIPGDGIGPEIAKSVQKYVKIPILSGSALSDSPFHAGSSPRPTCPSSGSRWT